MEQRELQPFRPKTRLTGYYPVPREMLQMKLSSPAILLYAVLLDKMTLSQKNGYVDEEGRVYVIYPIEKLAQTLSISPSEPRKVAVTLPAGTAENGLEICRLPLDRDCRYSIGSENIIEISGGSVRMIYADCPDKICVRTGAISRSGQSIVCAPHRVVITIAGSDGKESHHDYDVITN